VVGHGGRHAGRVLGKVDVAHAGARRAGVAVTAAVGAEEAGSDAGVVELQGGREVAVGLAGAAFRRGAGAVVLVQAVAVLVQRHGGDLAGVAAAAARFEEVQRRAVPVGVAGLVEVDVDPQLPLQPGVAGQPAAADFLDAVDVVELRARGVGVAGAAVAGSGAVRAAGGAEGDVAADARGLRDGAAGVDDAHELAVEGGAGAGGAEDAGRVGEAAGREVGVGHGPHDLGAGRRRAHVDAAGGLRVVVDVRELEKVAGGGVD